MKFIVKNFLNENFFEKQKFIVVSFLQECFKSNNKKVLFSICITTFLLLFVSDIFIFVLNSFYKRF